MSRWLPMSAGAILAGAAAVLLGRARESSRTELRRTTLLEAASQPALGRVDFAALEELPAPVRRYFRHALSDGQSMISQAEFRQAGALRTELHSDNWSSFTAGHLAVPPAAGFVWDARVAMPLGSHVRVVDSYVAGVGSGRASLLSLLPVARAEGGPEMNSGALHRYLAEAVWYPTALLPGAGVEWSPVDDQSAIARLSAGGTSVSLEFRFNAAGEVTGIYTAGRFGRFGGAFRQVPWEGHFRDYQARAGMRIPLYGEVGWYDGGTLHLVWKGTITEARYELGTEAPGR